MVRDGDYLIPIMESVVTLNVGGHIFQTFPSTLMKYPDTMLARCFASGIAKPNDTGEYFFDRDSTAFEAILNIYRNGKVICPPTVDREMFNDELKYWGFDELPVPVDPPSVNETLTRLTTICNFPKILGKILQTLLFVTTQQPSLHQILGTVIDTVDAKHRRRLSRNPYFDSDTDSDSDSDSDPSLMRLLRRIAAESKNKTRDPDPDLSRVIQVYQSIITAMETDTTHIVCQQIEPLPDWKNFLDQGYFHFSRIEKVKLTIESVYDHEMKGLRKFYGDDSPDYFYMVQGKRYYLNDTEVPRDKQVVVYICHL
jgi:hypothetical protein